MPLVVENARILTFRGAAPRRGADLRDAGVIERGHVVIEGDRIAEVGEGDAPAGGRRLDAAGRVVIPGFVDAHSHACWAGDRLDEWERRRAGASYLDILAAGGGILATVRAVRAASRDELAALLERRLRLMMREGTTTVEVKSGYGLATEPELTMLRAIGDAAARVPLTVVPTALLGHAIDPGFPGGRDAFVRATIEETLPAVHAEWPGIAIDAYCEEGAWSLDDCTRLFEAARALGHPVRVHADQFHALGMTEWAAAHGALSVDHLEATTPEAMDALARSAACGVMLPASTFHGGTPDGDARGFVDRGGALVFATNYNPGTSPCFSMPVVAALAVRRLGLDVTEAIAASTTNAASLLGLPDRGRIEPGMRADLVILRHRDERELAFELGVRSADIVIVAGEPAGDAS